MTEPVIATQTDGVRAELEATVHAQVMCFTTRDFAEGVQALVERRGPGSPASDTRPPRREGRELRRDSQERQWDRW